MISGLGIDLVRVSRIEALYSAYGNRFVNKVLTENEKSKLESLSVDLKARYIARRFAAKEAFLKCLGTGFNKYIGLNDIGTINDIAGKPSYEMTDKILSYLNKHMQIKNPAFFLSLSDDGDYANAVAILSAL